MKYEDQKAIREAIYRAVQSHSNNPEPVEVLTFQGFKVVVPAYMVPRRPERRKDAQGSGEDISVARKPIPYVHLIKNNTYYLEIESESGITARLNNFLESLNEQKAKYEDVLLSLETKLKITEEELNKEIKGYADEIDKLRNELKELNEELGVAS